MLHVFECMSDKGCKKEPIKIWERLNIYIELDYNEYVLQIMLNRFNRSASAERLLRFYRCVAPL